MKTKAGLGMKTTLGLAVLALLLAAPETPDGSLLAAPAPETTDGLFCRYYNYNNSFANERASCPSPKECCFKGFVNDQPMPQYGCLHEFRCNQIESKADASGCTTGKIPIVNETGGHVAFAHDGCVCRENECNEIPCKAQASRMKEQCAEKARKQEDRKMKRSCDRYDACATDARVKAVETWPMDLSACQEAYAECAAKFHCEDEAAAMKTECTYGLKDTAEDREKKRACDRYASCAKYPMVMGEKTDEACQEAYAACAIKSECGDKTEAMVKSCAFGLKDTAEDREKKRACDRYASCTKDPMVIGEKTDAACLKAYDGCACKTNGCKYTPKPVQVGENEYQEDQSPFRCAESLGEQKESCLSTSGGSAALCDLLDACVDDPAVQAATEDHCKQQFQDCASSNTKCHESPLKEMYLEGYKKLFDTGESKIPPALYEECMEDAAVKSSTNQSDCLAKLDTCVNSKLHCNQSPVKEQILEFIKKDIASGETGLPLRVFEKCLDDAEVKSSTGFGVCFKKILHCAWATRLKCYIGAKGSVKLTSCPPQALSCCTKLAVKFGGEEKTTFWCGNAKTCAAIEAGAAEAGAGGDGCSGPLELALLGSETHYWSSACACQGDGCNVACHESPVKEDLLAGFQKKFYAGKSMIPPALYEECMADETVKSSANRTDCEEKLQACAHEKLSCHEGPGKEETLETIKAQIASAVIDLPLGVYEKCMDDAKVKSSTNYEECVTNLKNCANSNVLKCYQTTEDASEELKPCGVSAQSCCVKLTSTDNVSSLACAHETACQSIEKAFGNVIDGCSGPIDLVWGRESRELTSACACREDGCNKPGAFKPWLVMGCGAAGLGGGLVLLLTASALLLHLL